MRAKTAICLWRKVCAHQINNKKRRKAVQYPNKANIMCLRWAVRSRVKYARITWEYWTNR